VSPEQQRRGIGNELLQRTLEHSRKARATTQALITFNRASQGLYIRHGLFPRLPIYNFIVPRATLMGRLQAQLRCMPLQDTPADVQRLAEIDVQTLGVSRAKHHSFLIADDTMRGVFLFAGGDCVGYAYVASDGHIGPLAVTQRAALGPAFRAALNLAIEADSPQVSAFLPGSASAALGIAMEQGMRITTQMELMSTHDFGNWTHYLPRNPGFM
jgi:hypothetical protein